MLKTNYDNFESLFLGWSGGAGNSASEGVVAL